ncbi:MAG TPA: 7-cyano-7-deazaguanine synthase [Longimicrobium sp.]
MTDNPESRSAETVVLLVSGGPDSATLAYLAEKERKASGGYINAIYLKTGHASDESEIKAAKDLIRGIGGKLEIIDISDAVQALGGRSVLMHAGATVMVFGSVFVLSLALAYAHHHRANKVMIGLHAEDAESNPEYSREYIDLIQRLATYTRNDGPQILTPFIEMRKAEVFRLGAKLGVNYSATWSCTRAAQIHCGDCTACRARRRAFLSAGLSDSTIYAVELAPAVLQAEAIYS